MAAIRDDRYLYEINQVYSHDANTFSISKDRSIGSFADITKDWYYYAICQEESLKYQMEDGVRLFDIRLNNVHCKTYNYWGGGWTWGEEGDGALYITHGKKQKAGTYYCQFDGKDLTLSVILDWVKDFLTEHPTETIMLSFTAETFQMDEYSFTGWVDEDGNAVTWPYTMPQQGATLTATWEVNSYTITFSTPADATQLDPITLPYGAPLAEIVEKLPDPVRPHYSMYNWVPQIPATMPAEDFEVTAHWRRYEYTLEFDANGGQWVDDDGNATTVQDRTGYYDSAVAPVPAPTLEGHPFEGWAVAYYYIDGTEVPPEDPNALVDVPDTMPDVSTKFVAKWGEHLWSSPDYSWADDFSSVTATLPCIDDETLTKTETVKTTAVLTTEPTCTTRGETTYTAVFTDPAFETVTLTIRDVDALGHDFGEGVVTRPATETEPGEMTWTCKNDPSHVLRYSIPVTWDASTVDFVIPFTVIEEEAFAGIAATHIEVQPNVEFIGPRAFADCPNLHKIHIPDSVTNVDDTALDGCQDVIVCGGTAAEYLAYINDFTFVQEPAE